MKHEDGIKIQILNHRERRVREYENPWQVYSKRFHGAFGNRILNGETGMPFKVIVDIGREYKSYRSQGTLITIVGHKQHTSGNGQVQSFWLDTANVRGRHIFTTFVLCDTQPGVPLVTQHRLRFPPVYPDYHLATADWMMEDYHTANYGCVSVCIQRGKLDVLKGTLSRYERDTMRTASGSRIHFSDETYRAVRSAWFKPLESENGDPYLFEYRNVVPQEVSRFEEADQEITHLDDLDEFIDYESDISDAESDDDQTVKEKEDPMDLDTGYESAASVNMDDADDLYDATPRPRTTPGMQRGPSSTRKPLWTQNTGKNNHDNEELSLPFTPPPAYRSPSTSEARFRLGLGPRTNGAPSRLRSEPGSQQNDEDSDDEEFED